MVATPWGVDSPSRHQSNDEEILRTESVHVSGNDRELDGSHTAHTILVFRGSRTCLNFKMASQRHEKDDVNIETGSLGFTQ